VDAAYAQAGGEASGPPAIYNIGFLVVLVAIFYLLLLRPEQRRRREHERMLGSLKRNDAIVLSSGLHGRVVAIGDKVLTVEIAPKIQVQVERSAVQSVARTGAAEGREKEREKS
jgi:preprotein translocase subunit YajC